jgi:hypothetical protein
MKALIHVQPVEARAEGFGDRFRDAVDAMRLLPGASGLELNRLQRLDEDPLRHRAAYHGTLEIRGAETGRAEVESLTGELVSRLAPALDLANSCLVIGQEHVFIASARAPVRYQYLMRRNDHFDHEAYLTRYRDVHSQFGIRTPGILGYTQLHVDPEASRAASMHAGIGSWDFDSVSELHLESTESFLSEVARSTVAREASEDERVFVDRDNSCAFCSRVEWQR